LLSIAPLAVVALTVAGLVFDPKSARGALVQSLARVTNVDVAATFSHLIEAAQRSGTKLAGAVAALLLLWAASRLFLLIQAALNLIWGVRAVDDQSTGKLVLRVALKRLMSFLMVLGCAALLLITLTVHALMSVVIRLVQRVELLADISKPLLLVTQELVIPLALLTPLLALIYRVLPDTRIRWRDVWLGAALTASLLLLGTWLLALLLGRISPAWLQGAIGSIAVFMVWTYYLAQVFLLGAAFTCAWSRGQGEAIGPASHAQLR
jgi:membrane protein